jgi:hypothetical protein
MKKPITLHEEQPRKPSRADVAPADGFTLVVDGHFKTKYESDAEAKAAVADLLNRYKMLKVEIYDGVKKERARFLEGWLRGRRTDLAQPERITAAGAD